MRKSTKTVTAVANQLVANASLQDKFNLVKEELNQTFESRSDEIDGLVLALLSKSNVMMLGEPGTGKSALLSRFASYFPTTEKSTTSKPFFKIQFSGQTKLEQILGPVDLAILKKESRIIYKGDNYASNARIALFDEFARGGQSTDVILTLVNEHQIPVDGEMVDCPLEMACGATNHKLDSDQLQAIRDRFLQWFNPQSIDLNNSDSLIRMWKSEMNPVTNIITESELAQAREEISNISIPDSTFESFINILKELKKELNIRLSDRRTHMMINLFKANAWMNNHSEVEDSDLLCAIQCSWVNPEDIDKVKSIITRTIDAELFRLNTIYTDVFAIYEEWVANGKSSVQQTDNVISKFRDYSDEIERLLTVQSKNQNLKVQVQTTLKGFVTNLSSQKLRLSSSML